MRQRSRNLTDLDYAKFAKLCELTSLCDTKNAHLVLAMHLNLPCSTITERVREAKRRGLLTQPGRGIRSKIFMTDKAKELLDASTTRTDNK
jgi:hypothetical protein